jgi:aminopeptidase N
VTLWDAVLDGSLLPERFLDVALEGLLSESVEQNVQRILDSLAETWWRLLPAPRRAALAAEVEAALWAGATGPGPATLRATFLSAYRRVAVTPEASARLARLWAGEERPPVPLSETDQTAIAWALAVREAPGWESVLEGQAARITNPDRRARFEFVRPALSADPAVREQLFQSLLDAENREREQWVLDALALLAHPLRQEHALRFVTPALQELEEIQRTGDIFFPDRWLDAALGGHASVAAAGEVRAFLAAHPEYPPRLRAKILQAADGLFRAARSQNGADGPA